MDTRQTNIELLHLRLAARSKLNEALAAERERAEKKRQEELEIAKKKLQAALEYEEKKRKERIEEELKQKEITDEKQLEEANLPLKIVRAILSFLANLADILNRYAGVTGLLHNFTTLASNFPGAMVGPAAALFFLVVSLVNKDISVASKIVNFFATTGSSGLSIAAFALQSIAIPLIMASVSVNFLKESFELGNFLYRKHYKKDTTLTKLQQFDAWQNFGLAAYYVVAVGVFFACPPACFIMLGLVAGYRFLDSIGKNPIKWALGLYDPKIANAPVVEATANENINEPSVENTSTTKVQITLHEEESKLIPKPIEEIKIKTRFKPGFFSVDLKSPQEASTQNKEITLASLGIPKEIVPPTILNEGMTGNKV